MDFLGYKLIPVYTKDNNIAYYQYTMIFEEEIK